MKKLLTTAFYFLIPVFIFIFLAEWFLTGQLKQSREGEYAVWNDIFNSEVNSEIIVHGSSRAMVHMDSQIISDSLQVSCYNLGINGHNFWLQYLRHKELLKYNIKPKLIIHSVDVFTLTKRPDLFNAEQFLPYMLNNEEIEYFTNSYKGFKYYDYHIPLIRYTGKYKTIGKVFNELINSEPPDSCRQRGYAPQDHTWNDDLEKAKLKFPDFKVQIDTASYKLFDEYIRECLAKDIEVVIVYTPEFIEGQDFVKNRSEILGIFRNFAEQYHLKFLDYSSDAISYNKDYFYNASHLNRKGSELFTKKLVYDLKKYKSNKSKVLN
ncbi:MAG: hypothetical protein JNL22_09395 [Bacteroidales bacterium]|nr:hypothetical protein [Bacteroidales bacterium]